MAADGAAVAPAEHGMRMHRRLVAIERDVPVEGQHLDLLPDGNAVVVLAFPVEVAQHRPAQRTDGAETAGRQRIRLGELLQQGNHFVARLEDECDGALGAGVADLGFHGKACPFGRPRVSAGSSACSPRQCRGSRPGARARRAHLQAA
ncbi:hypothetical protein FQZ97_766580 [compost metagenome]